MNVLALPTSLDHRSMDRILDETVEVESDRVLFDARHVRWADPNGMVALLCAGRAILARTGRPAHFQLPENTDTAGYMARMGFFRAADELFEFDKRPPRRASGDTPVLLEIMSISTNTDVHEVVERVQGSAGTILSQTLQYPATAVVPFSVILSEVCQNILEHAEAPGWVAAQVYNWKKRLGRHVLVLSVADMGRGFKASLTSEHSARFGDRWSDATALEAAFIHGVTRFPDSHRGQGIQQIRKQVRRWDGALSIRSGSARIADVPDWDEQPPLVQNLSTFPGSQISILLPAKQDAPGATDA